jgi:hypothetical protein
MAEQGTGIKKEFLIDSSDSARPAATLQSETKYFSDIKPKKRYLTDVIYEETGETAKTRKGAPVKLILKTAVYNDGCLVTTTVGEENEAYQEFKRTGVAMPSQGGEPTIVHEPSAAVKAAQKKALAKKKPAAKAADKE